MYYDDANSGGARIGLSSVLLLIIFVAAAGLILAAAIYRPWSDDDEPVVSNPVAEGQVDANAVAEGVIPDDGTLPGDAAAPEAEAPVGVAGP